MNNGRVKKMIVLIGNPNVGKSALFNALTDSYAMVSNYPGTSVELYRGSMKAGGMEYEVVDTPGMYSLMPITEEERVARLILMEERPDAVIHVVDAKNIERMLHLTLQLIEAGLKVILALNIIDEARKSGVSINGPLLEKRLKIPVVSTASLTNEGIDELKKRIADYV